MTKRISPIQLAVLQRLMETVAPDARLAVPQFADLATSQWGREEWAITPLKALGKAGLAERTPVKVGKASTWRITTAGVEMMMRELQAA
ncbi:hypothetical protein [Defluviimonas salinarum]|uniref:Mrr N-terminal domain-containing protein n=1 Tax=Defluviimonas salinarum TaxID=2992147 RepID=A0ABT3J4B2_9RHOB|nr:hypothetical protein [Defluviimonas salinarum]MCW3782524.1 hypothetical protein [Defluviimonas salinarum]